MGLNYVLEDEDRRILREIGDPKRILSNLLDKAAEARLPLLSGVDPYGDTVFNGRQIPNVVAEWQVILQWCTTEDQRTTIHEIVRLCQECELGIHTYIRIVGD